MSNDVVSIVPTNTNWVVPRPLCFVIDSGVWNPPVVIISINASPEHQKRQHCSYDLLSHADGPDGPGGGLGEAPTEPAARRLAAVPFSEMCEACLGTCGGLALSHLPNGTWQVLPSALPAHRQNRTINIVHHLLL